MSDLSAFSPSIPLNPRITVRVPATSANLGPGFDALGLALNLWNETVFQVAVRDSLRVQGEGAHELTGKTTTIAHEAARRVFAQLNLAVSGFHLEMRNAIPFSRGLGSSSAAIVAGLVGANEWAREVSHVSLSPAELLDLANDIEGHPDNVAPALLGGIVVAAQSDDGAVVSVQVPVAEWPAFVVWIPEAELATSHARSVLPDSISRADAVFNLARAALLVGALSTGNFDALGEALRDRLHQNQRASLVPGFWEFRATAKHAGSLGTTLSGAGPTILFWCADTKTAESVTTAVTAQAENLQIAGRALQLDAVMYGAYCTEEI